MKQPQKGTDWGFLLGEIFPIILLIALINLLLAPFWYGVLSAAVEAHRRFMSIL